MAEAVKISELSELGIETPNLYHIQESYLRQVAHAKPFTAKKKKKGEVAMTTAKWFRQKGTGRARQGARSNPHMHGGGRAFPPRPRVKVMKLNKHVRQSALRSAVLCHILDGSVYMIKGGDFDTLAKTREVATVLDTVTKGGSILLVLKRDVPAWISSRNLWNARQISPDRVNVRDLVETEYVVFGESALDEYRDLLQRQLAPQRGADGEDGPAGGEDSEKGA